MNDDIDDECEVPKLVKASIEVHRIAKIANLALVGEDIVGLLYKNNGR